MCLAATILVLFCGNQNVHLKFLNQKTTLYEGPIATVGVTCRPMHDTGLGQETSLGAVCPPRPCSYVPAYDRHYYIIIISIVIIIVVIDVFLSCLLTIILISTICSPQLSRVFQRSPNDRNLLRLSAFLKTAYPLYLFHTPLKHATLPRPFTDSTA